MKKLILIPFLVFSLSGCIYQSVSLSDMQSAMVICASKGSQIESIEASFYGSEVVTCTNRARYWIDKDTLDKAVVNMK